MAGIVNVLEQLPLLVVLTLAVLLVMGETGVVVGLFFPVEITLMFVGFLAYLGQVPLAVAFALMVAAAMAGDALALRSGRKYGPRVRSSWVGTRIGAGRWQRADRMLRRLGGRSAFVARWVPFVRTLLPRLAGSAGLPYRQFVGWNAVGAVTAVGSSVVVGYVAGASYERVADLLGRATSAVLLLALVILVIGLVGRWLGRHPDPVRALVSRAAGLPPANWLRRHTGALSARVGSGWALVINLLAGLVLLFGFGLGLSGLVQLAVAHSGLSRLDAEVAGWLADHRSESLVAVADAVTKVMRGSVLVVAVALVAVWLAIRGRWWRGDLVGLVGSAGAFMPLLVLAVAADLTGGDSEPRPSMAVGMFSTDATVATAGVCTLAWLLTRGAGWPRAAAGWTGAVVVVVILAAARLYPGWNTASETVTAVLLGGLWTSVFMVAWAVHDRTQPARPSGLPAGGQGRAIVSPSTTIPTSGSGA